MHLNRDRITEDANRALWPASPSNGADVTANETKKKKEIIHYSPAGVLYSLTDGGKVGYYNARPGPHPKRN